MVNGKELQIVTCFHQKYGALHSILNKETTQSNSTSFLLSGQDPKRVHVGEAPL